MATEIPSHNLNEVTQAAIALLKKPMLETADLMQYIPRARFCRRRSNHHAGGHCAGFTKPAGQRARARYEIEKLARGQWRVIVTRAAAER